MERIRKDIFSSFTTVIYSLSYSETVYRISWDSIFPPREVSRNCLTLLNSEEEMHTFIRRLFQVLLRSLTAHEFMRHLAKIRDIFVCVSPISVITLYLHSSFPSCFPPEQTVPSAYQRFFSICIPHLSSSTSLLFLSLPLLTSSNSPKNIPASTAF